MNPALASIVLPAYNQADHIGGVLRAYSGALADLPFPFELIVVVNGPRRDRTLDLCRSVEADVPCVRTLCIDQAGWGRAVRVGLSHARGDMLCYTNSSRTTAADLHRFLWVGSRNPDCVVKANRKLRESVPRRLGSLLYNLECRALFGVPFWDINGTPKVFRRDHSRLLELTRDDDVIDLEFSVACQEANYTVIEIPVLSTQRHSSRGTTGWRSAARMYVGAWRMRQRRSGVATE